MRGGPGGLVLAPVGAGSELKRDNHGRVLRVHHDSAAG
ncbi:hypothetical protein MPLB_1490048 [Mesorhizobium sp. ORS 3324]|nr:hypothetical protein MPLB_1490048 [Mesorhizobium sp. ORS 3324]